MKKFLTALLIITTSIFTNAQKAKVNWSTHVNKESDSIYTITLKASIEKGWHLYSQNLPENSTIPTSFKFTGNNEKYSLIGNTIESELITKFDKVFEMNLAFFEKEATFTQKIKLLDNNTKAISTIAAYQICDDYSCIFEQGEEINIPLENTPKSSNKDSNFKEITNHLKLNLKNTDTFLKELNASNGQKNNFSIFFLGFLGGLIALLTPCVFPMIPLTVSFFSKQSKSKNFRNAFIYGVFIILIYFLLSLPFHLMDSLDPEILNSISTSVWLNLLFFVVFIFFAFSFFGFYELRLPSTWGNKTDTASDNGGIIGTFFMALTLAIVSFSCTGPILGSLLVGSLSSDGGATQLSLGMIGFGTALSLPFTLFALFPGWLNALPKSGGWLNTVKVVLGFLEVALALKFLSNADLVQHWGLLKREVFIGLWIIIFLGLSLYLFGKIKFPHDSPIKKLSKTRILLASISTGFTLYMISGLFFNTSLNILSGFPPPNFYSINSSESDCPLGLDCYNDFETGLEAAKANNKPIMIDFTGWACVNCRKMEENIWTNPKVHNQLSKFIIISLYVDDKESLPLDEQFEYIKENENTKHIKTIGSKWATFQTVNFHTTAQPYYILMNSDLELLNSPKEYSGTEEYLSWLKIGLKNFKEKQ